MLQPQIVYEDMGVKRAYLDLDFFSEWVWQDDPEHRPNAPMHTYWYNTLQHQGVDGKIFEETGRIHWEAPREHAKTTCLSVKYPLFRMGHDPNIRILVCSKAASLATDILSEVRRNIDYNERLQQVFPNLLPGQPWTDSQFTVERTRIDKSKTMRAVGLHGMITGGRADLIICDDPFDETEARTAAQREKIVTFIEKVLIPTLTPNGELIFPGTRWHYDDYWNNLIEKDVKKGGRYLIKIYRPTVDMDDPKSELKSLWPQVWPIKKLLERKEDIGTINFNCLMLNDPSGYEGLIFKEKWLQYYNPYSIHYITKMRLFMGVDPSISEDPSSDYTAIIVLGFDPGYARIYILDIYREQIEFPEQVRKIKEKYLLWKSIASNYGWAGPIAVGIESVAYQKALAQATFMQGIPAKEISRRIDKLTRLVGMSPHFEGGRILLPDPAIERMDWLKPFIDEYITFPKGKNDDQLDALDCAVECANIVGGRGGFYFG